MKLDEQDHKLPARWAADCAGHVLSYFEEHPADDRPRNAVQAGRAWARGEIRMGEARATAREREWQEQLAQYLRPIAFPAVDQN